MKHELPRPALNKASVCCATLLFTVFVSACSSSDDSEDDTLPGDEGTSMPSPTFDLVPETRAIESIGTIYVNDDELSLYTRHTDSPGEITCVDACAETWPPLITSVTAQGISGNFDVIERPDGSFQWTLLGYPLHLYSGDAAANDVSGNGEDGEWALARPIPVTSGDVGGEEALVALGSTLEDPTTSARLDRDNFTLYFFENDTAGESSCNGGCADNWPPLYADTGAVADGNRYSLITRDDGTRQWAYDGKALYYWQGDSAAGESTGTEVANWVVARP